MTGTSTLYPFELFRLLEALWEDRFAGSVALRALDETTTLYLVDGQVRYATTTDVTGTFPGYLLTERIFSRDEIHSWLKRCGEEQRTLEDLLLSDGVLDAAAAVALKADLGRRGVALPDATQNDIAAFHQRERPGLSDLLDGVLDTLRSDPQRAGGHLACLAPRRPTCPRCARCARRWWRARSPSCTTTARRAPPPPRRRS